MAETEPGRTKPDSTWPGTWTTIAKADYDEAVAEAMGLSGLSVFASATRPNGDDYTYTAWGLKGADFPLIASELRGCGPDWSRVPGANCPGSHTFWSFTPWPQWRCTGCGEVTRHDRPDPGEPVLRCEDCNCALGEVTPCRHCGLPITQGHGADYFMRASAERSPTGWTHLGKSPAEGWQGIRCPGSLTGATPAETGGGSEGTDDGH